MDAQSEVHTIPPCGLRNMRRQRERGTPTVVLNLRPGGVKDLLTSIRSVHERLYPFRRLAKLSHFYLALSDR